MASGEASGARPQARDAAPDSEPNDAHEELETLFGLAPGQGDSWFGLARAALAPAPPLGRLGAYELVAELGRGGQGTVYRALQPVTGRTVALKCLPARAFTSESSRERFRREFDALARLSHPNVVAVHGAEIVDEHALLVMEWVDGRPIDAWARGRPLREVVATFLAVCDAVAHAHRRGVLHRDLKPSNILVDAAGRPRVLDFGLAKLLASEADGQLELSRSATFLGTPSFAPPEQIEGRWEAVDTRSDVYALGAVLHLVLAEQPAFESSGSLPELFDRIRAGLPQRPSAVLARAGRELDWIVRTALAVEPGRRYGSVDALGDDLRRWLAGEEVAAHPPQLGYRLRKAWARHRVLFSACAALALLGLAFTATVTVLAVRLRRQGERLELALESESDAARAQRFAASFFGNLLGGASDLRRVGAPLSLEQVLDQGVADLDAGSAKHRPSVEAELRMQLGRGYRGFGAFAKAETQHRRAVELASGEALVAAGSAEHSANSAAIQLEVRALDYLMRTLEACGKLADAEAVGLRALAKCREFEGADGNSTIAVQNDLAAVLDEQGRYAEAEALCRAGIAAGERRDFSKGAQSGMHRNLGLVLLEQGRFAEAEAETRKALDLGQAFDVGSDRRLRAQRNLARILAASERGDEAERLLRTCVHEWSELLGEAHPQVAVERSRLAALLSARGQHAEAQTMARASWEALDQALGADHLWTTRARRTLGLVLQAAGARDAAQVELSAACHAAARAAPGAEKLAVDCALSLATCLREQGRDGEARAVLLAARERAATQAAAAPQLRDGCLRALDAALRSDER